MISVLTILLHAYVHVKCDILQSKSLPEICHIICNILVFNFYFAIEVMKFRVCLLISVSASKTSTMPSFTYLKLLKDLNECIQNFLFHHVLAALLPILCTIVHLCIYITYLQINLTNFTPLQRACTYRLHGRLKSNIHFNNELAISVIISVLNNSADTNG